MAQAKQTKNTETTETKKKQVKHAKVVAETVPVAEAPEVKLEITAEPQAAAKAGKRSSKAVREEEQKAAKEVRKAEAKQTADNKETKPATKPPRSKTERAGKKYREAAEQIDKDNSYDLAEALALAVKTSRTKFDASVELHINLGVDPKQADQNVRDSVVMPAGTGKDVVVAVLDESSAEKLFTKLDKEEIDFDILIATPEMMPRLGKYARLLGPRGLMPNPKSGTVTIDTNAAAKEAKAGKVEYRVDQAGIVHLAIGKVSFGADKLAQNAEAVLGSVRAARPASLKGIYIKSVFVSTTMGPSIRLEPNS